MRPAGGERPLTYGLMPRGLGDCGLMNDGDLYGVFFPHNIWAVYADRCSLEAAEILGKTDDVAELKKIYETARDDLLAALDRGAITEKDYRWIPGVPGKTSGSRWGALNVAFPCGLLPPDHRAGHRHPAAHRVEHQPGRTCPVHTGWMADGMWVAITLDNVAEAHLPRGNGDAAAKYLYATLNHGTPLYTWCEERGQEPGTHELHRRPAAPVDAGGRGPRAPRHAGDGKRRRTEPRPGHGAPLARLRQAGRHRRPRRPISARSPTRCNTTRPTRKSPAK